MTAQQPRLRPARRQLVILLLAAIALYIVAPQFGEFRHSLSSLSGAQWNYLLPALVGVCLSYLAAAGTYCLLAWRPLSYTRTLLIQVAGMFVNRLLPAGIGGISVNYLYLRRSGHSGVRAASVVTANNFLGILGNVILLVGIVAILYHDVPPLRLERAPDIRFILLCTLAAVIAWVAFYRWYGERLNRKLRDFLRQIAAYRQRPGRTIVALACQIGLTLANVLAFGCCLLAVQIGLPVASILIVFSFGVLLGTATPTPGGLGGVEAGLVAGLVVYQVDGAAALAAVLIYRLISYWLPLAVGAAAFVYTQKKDYL